MRRIIQRSDSFFLKSVAILVAACVVLAVGLSVSPDLHEKLHHDAGHAHHECLVTMIASGGMDHVTPAPVAVSTITSSDAVVRHWHPVWVRPLFLDGSVLEHAPPGVA